MEALQFSFKACGPIERINEGDQPNSRALWAVAAVPLSTVPQADVGGFLPNARSGSTSTACRAVYRCSAYDAAIHSKSWPL